jgi:hypothetical protein
MFTVASTLVFYRVRGGAEYGLVTIDLDHDGDLTMTDPGPARVRVYRRGRLAEEGLPLSEVPDRLAAWAPRS